MELGTCNSCAWSFSTSYISYYTWPQNCFRHITHRTGRTTPQFFLNNCRPRLVSPSTDYTSSLGAPDLMTSQNRGFHLVATSLTAFGIYVAEWKRSRKCPSAGDRQPHCQPRRRHNPQRTYRTRISTLPHGTTNTADDVRRTQHQMSVYHGQCWLHVRRCE